MQLVALCHSTLNDGLETDAAVDRAEDHAKTRGEHVTEEVQVRPMLSFQTP